MYNVQEIERKNERMRREGEIKEVEIDNRKKKKGGRVKQKGE